MEDIVREVSRYVNEWALQNLQLSPDTLAKDWSFAELVNRESRGKDKKETVQPIPVTINGTGDREQISLNDKYDFINWVRVTVPARRVRNAEDAFGLSQGNRQGFSLRMVIAHKVELGEDVAYDIAASLPETLYLDGYNFVFVSDEYTVDPDHEKIYLTELGKTVYELHRFNWNLYTIDVNVEYSKCIADITFNPVDCVPAGDCITDESGDPITP
jgi:hypothetical protein